MDNDLSQMIVDANIEKHNITYYENYFKEYLRGEDTEHEFMQRELESTINQLNIAVSKGHGNYGRFLTHKKNVLIKLMQKKGYTTTQPTPPQKEIQKIKWLGKNINDLAYLFWKMQNEKLIAFDSFEKIMQQNFVNGNGEPFTENLFNKYSSEFNKGKYPTNVNEIENLINLLKKGIEKA